jgi:NAD(P)-dependent dehydrogenase (short-subunit alcohol dehydrogenase family)
MWTKENMNNQSGKTAIVTGANAGVGFETALALYEKGAHVIVACRDREKANNAIERMKANVGEGSLEAGILDLSELESVKRFTEAFTRQNSKLDLLINNAGVMRPPASKTTEGFELQFGVNFIGHFALAGYLYPMLKGRPGSRVVTVSSNAYLRGIIDFENLRLEKPYDKGREYAQSKLADIFLAIELQRRIMRAGDSVVSIAAQPGANNTALLRHLNSEEFTDTVKRVGPLMEPWQGALPTLYAATVPDAIPGALYGPDQDGGFRGYPALSEIQAHALDEQLAQKLWAFAEDVTGIKFP